MRLQYHWKLKEMYNGTTACYIPGGGGGGHSGTEGGRTLVTYFAEEEVFF